MNGINDQFILNYFYRGHGKPSNNLNTNLLKEIPGNTRKTILYVQKNYQQRHEKNNKYYKNAINTWTIYDVKKRNIAKKNNLNYIEFWNISSVKKWIFNYESKNN